MSEEREINRGHADNVPLSTIIVRDGFNARGDADVDIGPLAESIEDQGLLQPLVLYRLNVPEDDDAFGLTFLQSGFRRKSALDRIAEKRRDPDLGVDVIVKVYDSHDEAMLSALAVDTTGEPLKIHDVAKRLDELHRKGHTQQALARLSSLSQGTVSLYINFYRKLHPAICKVWEKQPRGFEFTVAELKKFIREEPEDQLRLLEAFVNGETEILDDDGKPKRNRRGQRLDGKTKRSMSRQEVRQELESVLVKLEREEDPNRAAFLRGAARALRFALGDERRAA